MLQSINRIPIIVIWRKKIVKSQNFVKKTKTQENATLKKKHYSINKNKKKTAKIRSEKMKQKTVKQQQQKKSFLFNKTKKGEKKQYKKILNLQRSFMIFLFCFIFH